ncbi:MAG: DUF4012 domain-containing protein [bacterium]
MKTIKKRKNRRQVRRCSSCGKAGHNRSTCQGEKIGDNQKGKKPDKPSSLNLYIHHVSSDPAKSEHIVDLKKNNAWTEVQTVHPQYEKALPYHYYHEQTFENSSKGSGNLCSFGSGARPCTDSVKLGLVRNEELNLKNTAENSINNANNSYSEKQNPTRLNFAPKSENRAFTTLKNSKPKRKNKFKTVQNNLLKSKEAISGFNNRLARNTRGFFKMYFPIQRTAISLVVFSLIIFAPTQARTYYQNLKSTSQTIADSSINGFSALKDSTTSMLNGDFNSASNSLSVSLNDFNSAVQKMNNSHRLAQKIISYIPILNEKIADRQNLLLAGQNIALGNADLLEVINKLQSQTSSTLTITKSVQIVKQDISQALDDYQIALDLLNSSDVSAVPAEYREQFKQFKALFGAFVSDLQEISNSAFAINEIFGGQGLRRYLLMFQNPHELRPTGGFMGSFALLELKNGKIINLEIPAGGTYDVKGQLTKYVEPPAPMLLVNSRWHMHDANWFPDFPASAEKIMWFYQHSREITVDGVIAINADVLNRVLNLTGPILDESRSLVITSEDAIETIQKVVEHGSDKKINKPKQIIADLAPKFIDYFKNLSGYNILPILHNLQDALAKKEIQLYFIDKKTQQIIEDFGWAGKIIKNDNTSQDYLMVVNTNLLGEKSDAVITQKISHQAEIQPNGTVIDTVSISRTHSGNVGEEFYGKTNIDYLRLYVPQGSQLIDSGGFSWISDKYLNSPEVWYEKDQLLQSIEKEIGIDPISGTRITEEFEKTAFGNWVVTEPGKSSVAYFKYKLPFKITIEQIRPKSKWIGSFFDYGYDKTNYQFIVQKQSGINSAFESQVIFPFGWNPFWYDGQGITGANNGATIGPIILESDKLWTLMMKKE